MTKRRQQLEAGDSLPVDDSDPAERDPGELEYAFTRVEFKAASMLASRAKPSLDTRRIIRQRAARGWRFVQAMPVEQTRDGQLTAVDLVFERGAR